MEFRVDGRSIRAHKLILGLRSNYFKQVLQKPGTSYHLFIPYLSDTKLMDIGNCDFNTFQELIRFCYKPVFTFKEKENLMKLQEVNATYRVIELNELIDEKLKASNSNSNSSKLASLQTSAAIQTEMAPGT